MAARQRASPYDHLSCRYRIDGLEALRCELQVAPVQAEVAESPCSWVVVDLYDLYRTWNPVFSKLEPVPTISTFSMPNPLRH